MVVTEWQYEYEFRVSKILMIIKHMRICVFILTYVFTKCYITYKIISLSNGLKLWIKY